RKLSKIGVLDATGVALKTIKQPISNTAILGAFARTVGIIKLSSLEEAIKQILPERLHNANIESLRMAYNETKVLEM
ncbi:2-oxoacid:acceptor oxidoreductase family protein, partial [Candidatus Bathyarchaeota archaeon]|nr:2-oxoacid:acceptor oxidoreductase family protein [Candidatus Bathyarchaeota archaeon]